jgi:hypothetical protein
MLGTLLLGGCGGVQVRPQPALPQPLLAPMTARVGLVLDEELRTYIHDETRGGTHWKAELGPGHDQLFRTIFGASFATLETFDNAAAARGKSLQAIFRPQIQQFSFATDDETGGEYWAVTIRYNIVVSSSEGEVVDNLSLTGYGSSRGGRAANALTSATQAAMRDAAAKFLVQMPALPLGRKLANGDMLTPSDAPRAQDDPIGIVPIDAD